MRINAVKHSFVILLIVLFVSACSGINTLRQIVDPPKVSLSEIKLISAGLLEQRYLLSLRVQNPNGVAIPVNGLDYRVNLGDAEFARGFSASSFSLPANGEDTVDIEVSTNLLDSARQVYNLIKRGDESVEYSLSGNVKVDLPFVTSLPFSRTGQVDLSGLNAR